MAETLINNNQLNLGDLSGAYVELSQIVTAGKKKIVESLTAKGVTNITYSDTLTKMSEGIDALETNGVGGVNPQFPILIYDSTYPLSDNETYTQKLGNYFSGYSSGFIRVGAIPTNPSDGTTTVSMKLYDSNAIRNSSAWTTEDGQEVTYSTSYFDIAPIYGDGVTLGRKFLYAGGTCRVIVDLDEGLNISLASARNMQTQEGNIIASSSSSSVKILGANWDKDMAIVYWSKISSIIKITLSTGVYEPVSISGLSGLTFSGAKLADINTSIVYSSTYNTKQLAVIHWDWNNIENSTYYTYDLSNTSGPIKYGRPKNVGGGSVDSSIYFTRRYSDDELKVIRYSPTTHAFYDIIVKINSLNRFSNILYSSGEDIGEGLTVLNYSMYNKVLLFYGEGYLYLNTASWTPTVIPYIYNSSVNSAITVYGWPSSKYSTDNHTFSSCYINNNLYMITNSGKSMLRLSRINIVYNKILATVAHQNSKEVVYKNSTIVTKDNIQDGGPFDATNIVLPVEI